MGRRGARSGRRCFPLWRGRALICGAVAAKQQADAKAATQYAEEAFVVASAAGDGFGITSALRERGKAAAEAGDLERPRALYEELAEVANEVGDAWNGAIALNNLGDLALYDGDWTRAIELCKRSAEIRRGLGNIWGAALCLCNVALAQRQAGLLADAAGSLHQALEDSLAVDARMVVLFCCEIGALLSADRERPQETATLLGAIDRLREELGTTLDDFERPLIEGVEGSTRARLGEDDFARAFEHGRSLLLEDTAARVFALTSGA